MDLAKLVIEKQMLNVIGAIKVLVFKQMRIWYPSTTDQKSFVGGTILFTQLLLQDAITRIGLNDPEIDHTLENESLTLLGKLSLIEIVNVGGLSSTRLQARCKKLKGVTNIGKLELWDIPYWLSMTTLLKESECKKMLQTVADWLDTAAKQTLEYIVKSEPVSSESINTMDLDFGTPNQEESNDVAEKPRKKGGKKNDLDPMPEATPA
jgi:hypothetical protein